MLDPNAATDEQRRIGNEMKVGVQKFAFALLPGETSVQSFRISIDKEQIANAPGTPNRKVIIPMLLGVVDYKSSLGNDHHQSGYMIWMPIESGYLPFDSTSDEHPPVGIDQFRYNMMPEGWFAD